ncbi:MAG: response regulator [Deltaproteobacteria bacterium]|nr:response regulator [Deltaproteobacteria bacterium]
MEAKRDFIMPASPQGQNEMEIHPIFLSFPDELEKDFQSDYYRNSLKTVRFSLLAGIVLYSFFGILDARLVPELKTTLWAIRFGVVCPFLLGVIGFSYFPIFRHFFQFSVASAMIVAGSAIIYMIAILPPPVNQTYYAGLILVFIWGYTFTRVRFIWATSAGWILVALYEFVAIGLTKSPVSVLMNNNFFFISSNLVGMFACYFIEYYTRRDFFLAFKLEKEQDKVKSANRRLEKIVMKRTAQIQAKNKELSDEIEERKSAEKERKKLESKLQEAQKMEALGKLAGGIAHDFNNLLMGIQGNISLLLLNMDPDDPKYERLKNSEKYVVRGSELTRQLLGFARGGKYEVKPTDLNGLIIECAKLFGRTKKEISLDLDFEDEVWAVSVDRAQIEQVLLNLFVNAWQAMPGGGDLLIRSRNVTIEGGKENGDQRKAGRYVKISVTDNGIGMDHRTMKRIFDPFFTTKEVSRGTGMGLASAYGIIKNHGGFFQVQSKVGQGSTFSFFLPAEDKAVVKEKACETSQLLTGKETILLVDDEEMIADVASDMLKNLGYDVLTAKSGEEAVEVYKELKSKVDLVILDLIMPGMSGSRTFDLLREENPDIKVLLSSGYSLTGEASTIMSRGCSGFVQKPYNIHKLSQKVREILQ